MKLQQLLEALSSIVYHATTLDSAFNIIKDGKFILSNSIGNRIEAKHAPDGYPYYLSTTRSKTGAYHSGGDYKVVFVLDGNFYNQHHKSNPVSYWGGRAKHRDEAEDRIFSKTNS
jgi:hypothetical protein